VGSKGWILLTTDKRIRYNFIEKRALERYVVREFVFASGNMSGQEMATALEIALRKMQKFCRQFQPPFCRCHYPQRRSSHAMAEKEIQGKPLMP
jgi:hypothetical protein